MPFLPCAWSRALVCRFHKWWLRLRRPSPDPLGVAQARSVCAICFEGMCELPHTSREGFEIDRLTNAFAKKIENHACAVVVGHGAALGPAGRAICNHAVRATAPTFIRRYTCAARVGGADCNEAN